MLFLTLKVYPIMSSINSIDSHGTLQWDMMELARHLRQERLFVNSEQQNLQSLNERVSNIFRICLSAKLYMYNVDSLQYFTCI